MFTAATTPRRATPDLADGLGVFAFAASRPVTGEDFPHAFVLGFDSVTRIGDATYPTHFQAGWHNSGSICTFGAAVALGRLPVLDEQQVLWRWAWPPPRRLASATILGRWPKHFIRRRSAGRVAGGQSCAGGLHHRGDSAGGAARLCRRNRALGRDGCCRELFALRRAGVVARYRAYLALSVQYLTNVQGLCGSRPSA